MLKAIFAAALIVSLGSSAALSQNKVTRAIAVDEDFRDVSQRWTGATPGGYEAFVALKGNQGMFELCGVGAITNIQLSSAINNMLRGGKLTINGKVVLKNFRYFAKARSSNAVKSTKANCARTSMKIQKINSLDFRYGNGTFRN